MQTNTLKDQSLKQKTTNYSLNLGQMWRLWAKALGEKAHKRDQVADKVAVIRTVIFASYLITNMFIVAGVIRHWNDNGIEIYIDNQRLPISNSGPNNSMV
jgi:hypothetical protein